MMKNKFIFIIIVTLAISGYVRAQTSGENQSVLVGSFSQKTGDFSEAWDNMKQRLKAFDSENDILAVRLCSSDQLATAVTMSYVSLFEKFDELETQGVIKYEEVTGKPIGWTYYVPRKQVILLRNDKNCPLSKNGYAETEFWIVPPNAELPSFVESRRATDLAELQITSFDNYLNNTEKKELSPELFKKALQKTAEFMKENRTAAVTISISFVGRIPSKTLSNRVSEIRQFLLQKGIGEYRIFIKKSSLGNKPFFNDFKENYPRISIIYPKQ